MLNNLTTHISSFKAGYEAAIADMRGLTTGSVTTNVRRRTSSGRARGGVSAIQNPVTQGTSTTKRRRSRRRRPQQVAQQLP